MTLLLVSRFDIRTYSSLIAVPRDRVFPFVADVFLLVPAALSIALRRDWQAIIAKLVFVPSNFNSVTNPLSSPRTGEMLDSAPTRGLDITF